MISLAEFAAELTTAVPGGDGIEKRSWRPDFEPVEQSFLEFAEAGGCGWTRDGLFHFFGPDGPPGHELEAWNEPDKWRSAFGHVGHWVSVAEDVFGHQFMLKRSGSYRAVKVLSLWNGTFQMVAGNFADFIRDVVVDRDSWQSLQGLYERITAQPGMEFRGLEHLSPIQPILLGGSGDDPANFAWCESVANASIQAQLFSQLRA